MSRSDWSFLWLPLLTILLGLPMIMGLVSQNGIYGFRTTKTLSSPEIWHRANRMAGWDLVIASLASVVLYFVLKSTDLALRTVLMYSCFAFSGLLIVAIIVALFQLSRL